MTRTVDVVVSGGGRAALTATVQAIQSGRRVLVVLPRGGTRAAQGFRGRLRRASNADDSLVTVITNAEVVCVEGVDCVEAVVIRRSWTGRMCAVNASAFLSCDCTTGADKPAGWKD